MLDSDWEGELCRVVEGAPAGEAAYVKNHNLGFEVPYQHRLARIEDIVPDFIVLLRDRWTTAKRTSSTWSSRSRAIAEEDAKDKQEVDGDLLGTRG